MNRHNVMLSTFCLLLVSGCASNSTQRYQFINESSIAESYSQSGQHQQAASLYQTLALSKPAQQDEFNLLAAEAFIQSGDNAAAQSSINLINPHLLNAEQRNKLNLILIQISLSHGDAEKALTRLSVTQPYHLSPFDQIAFYQSLAFAHSLTGDLIQSVHARIQLTPLLESIVQRHENNKVILDTLNLLPSQTLSFQQPPAPDILGGWMALAHLLKNNALKQNANEYQTYLSEWQRLFPQHPATIDFIQSYTRGLANTFNIPQSIAILLPESGRFAKAAEAIKIGLMAAYHQAESVHQPSIRFYDTSSGNSVSLYHQALSEGAELVIGPLSKDNIQDLALSTHLTIPVLALNHVTNLAKDNLFQFGLSPIDEARQITNKAVSDGIKKVVILTSESNRGHRMADYLAEHWQQANGTVLETEHYNNRENDFSTPIKSLLNIDESRYRHTRIKQYLARNLEFTERRRQDIDAIFLSASAQKARSIYPQLQFHRATQVPVYALPQIYSGEPNPSADIDLNSIVFCDIPWLFPNLFTAEPSKESLRDSWQQLLRKYLRLVALGIDSFNLSSNLKDIASVPFPGATGSLSINSENRITRQLVCAKFINGRPVIQDTVNPNNAIYFDSFEPTL